MLAANSKITLKMQKSWRSESGSGSVSMRKLCRSHSRLTRAKMSAVVRVPCVKTNCSGCEQPSQSRTKQPGMMGAKLYKSESVNICFNFDKPRLTCPS